MKRKNYVVIGGSKGIGEAIIRDLLPSNNIINISRTRPDLEHEHLKHIDGDILDTNLPDIESLDGLVYCPGSINLKPITRLDLEDFRRDFEINVLGAVKAIKHFLPSLKNGLNPSIVLFSTVASKLGMPFHASIATAKSGVEGLVKSLGAELAPVIRVNAIAPTITNTSLSAKLLRNERVIETMKERHPMKQILEPKDVAEMATFLLSDKTSTISGQIFEMDCGIVSFKL